MPVFAYKATAADTKVMRGTIASNSPREAREMLRQRGWQVLEIARQEAKPQKSPLRLLPERPKHVKEVASFTGEMGTLLSVGVPLLEAMDTLIKQYDGGFRQVMIHLRDEVSSGASFAEAMQSHPRVFDSLCVSMAEVGENTGNLDGVLTQLSDFKTRSLDFQDRVLSSMMYPMIVLGVALFVTTFLMLFVVPMLLQNLIDAGRQLPWPTLILKSISDLLLGYFNWIAGGLLLGLVMATTFFNTSKGRWCWYWLISKVPVLGDLSRKQEIARVSLVIATMTQSGVEFLRALEIATKTTRNQLLQDALHECQRSIRSGGNIGDAMARQQYLPPMVAQIFAVGQNSGQLEEMLFRLASDYDRQVQTAANRVQSVLEPILIIGLSVFVGFILFATLLPILEAGNALNRNN